MKINYNRLAVLTLILCWAGMIFTAIGLPMRVYPEVVNHPFTFYDKAIHMVLFGVFAYLIIIYFKTDRKLSLKRIYLIGFVVSVIYIISTEYYQAFVPGRHSSETDTFFGSIGVLAAIWFDYALTHKHRPKLLLHICCIGCGAYVSQVLQENYKVVLYFYNPNIWPLAEMEKRLEEIKKVARKNNLKVIVADYNHDNWLQAVKGHEQDPEKGERCRICYQDRMEATAKHAQAHGFSYFTTTLTVSPHKDAKIVSAIGKELAEKYGVGFLDQDFKKQDGFKKSARLSKDLGLYRQDYCGCEFSLAYGKCKDCL